jgi:uncharacterized protein YodC (DUF2158 family)
MIGKRLFKKEFPHFWRLAERRKVMDIQIGDIVQLKSGGPDMTVTDVEESLIYCDYFDKMNDKIRETYPEQCLKKIDKL